MDRNIKLIKNTLIYTIANFGSKVLSFIVVPIYTYFIIPTELGEYDYWLSVVSLFAPLLSLQIMDAVYRWLLDRNEDFEVVIRTGRQILLCSMVLFLLPILFFDFLQNVQYYWLYILLLYLSVEYNFDREIIRGLKDNTQYAFIGVFFTVINLSFSCFFVIALKMSAVGLLTAQIVAYLVSIIYIFLRNHNIYIIKGNLSIRYIKSMLKYCLPFIPNVISWWIMNLSDRMAIKMFIDVSALGIYAISCKFPTIIQSFISIFQLSWQQTALEEYNSPDKSEYNSLIFEKLYIFLFLMVSMLISSIRMIIALLDPLYYEAWMYVPFLFIGAAFAAFATFWSAEFYGNKRTASILYTTMIAAIINLLINIIFMPIYGLQVASVSTFISYCSLYYIRMKSINKENKFIINKRKFYSLFGYCMFCVILTMLENSLVDLLMIIISIGLMVLVQKNDLMKIYKMIVYRLNGGNIN